MFRSEECAIEIMVLNPDPAVHHNNKSVHENLWIKERYGKNNYLSIGVMLKEGTAELQFYFFEDCDKRPNPKFYSSLEELQNDLPLEKKSMFKKTHKVYLMGHGDIESKYGFGNYHAHDDFSHPPDPTEQIYDDNFDHLITHILKIIPDTKGMTLEQCHADNLVAAEKEGYSQSFLERLSETYPQITFSGTGPWSDSKELQESVSTDSRASGGYPTINAPITSMGGGIWKHGNTVIFHDDDHQFVVKKSPFASTDSAKELKINTVNYARNMLDQVTSTHPFIRKAILARICVNRDILIIDDLKKEPDFKRLMESEKDKNVTFVENKKIILDQNRILNSEKTRYLDRIDSILKKKTYSDRDVLMIALGLNHPFIFKGNERVYQDILSKKSLLELVMVSCGKVLMGAENNNNVIDLLIKIGISINSVDEKGMTALHYAANNFYVYRSEPLNLVKKLLDCGADVDAVDNNQKSPLLLATEQSRKETVMGGEDLRNLLLLKSNVFKQSIAKHAVASGRMANCFFQSFMHTLTSLDQKTLDKIQSKYAGTIKAFVDTFNNELSLKSPINFNQIMKISRELHPLEQECVFGPILRHAYDTMIDRNILTGEKLKHGPDDIMLATQTVVFANAFGCYYNVYMSEEQFELGKKGGMPSDVAKYIEKTGFDINGRQFFRDHPPGQMMKNGKMFDLDIVYADKHLNYTLGDPKRNNELNQQIITERTKSKDGVFAVSATEKDSAPLAISGLNFENIKNKFCDRFQLARNNYSTTSVITKKIGGSSDVLVSRSQPFDDVLIRPAKPSKLDHTKEDKKVAKDDSDITYHRPK